MQLPIPVPSGFRIIAHRGASAYAPENTLSAFELARNMGVVEIELDTQLTRDSQVALCHDSSLTRYGHGERRVEALTWDELAPLDMGSWFSPHLFSHERMLTLDRLFDRYGDHFVYHVELKGRALDLPRMVRNIIEHHGMRQSCIVTSFQYDALVAMREIDADLQLGWLVNDITDTVLEQAQALALFQLCPRADRVTKDAASRARGSVSEIRAWRLLGNTVLGQAAEVQALIAKVLDAGCDGMTINWPDWVCPTPDLTRFC